VGGGGVPFEETARRLWFRRMPGRGLGRLYGPVVPWPDVEVTEVSPRHPRNLNVRNGNTVP